MIIFHYSIIPISRYNNKYYIGEYKNNKLIKVYNVLKKEIYNYREFNNYILNFYCNIDLFRKQYKNRKTDCLYLFKTFKEAIIAIIIMRNLLIKELKEELNDLCEKQKSIL